MGPPRAGAERGAAFSLVELLVVMAILALLAGMMMPLLSLAQRGARRSATQAVMARVEVALRQFRDEVGAWPWQEDEDEFAPGTHPLNRLGRRLGTELSDQDLADLNADADLAVLQYRYILHPTTLAEATVGAQAFRKSDVRPAWSKHIASGTWVMAGALNPSGTAIMLNRMGAERARRAVLAGELGLTGVRMADVRNPNTGAVAVAGRDLSGTTVIPAGLAKGTARPGWSADYLAGAIEARYLDGEAIRDAWGTPLIYVGRVTEGCTSTRAMLVNDLISGIDPKDYGLAPLGRRTLAAGLAPDPPALPDPAQPKRSDRRRYAPPGGETACELWSAGPDRRFDWQRDATANRDNVPIGRPDQGLP